MSDQPLASPELASPERERRESPTAPVAHPPGSPKQLRRVALGALLAVVGIAVWYFAFHEPANDSERFQGEWKLIDARQPPLAEDEVRVGVRVKGDTWQYVAGGRDGKAYRITLNETANPREIDLELIDNSGLKGGAVKLRGVYAFDGNRAVRVRVKDANEPRPKSLDDPDATDWLLTKVKLQPAPAPK